MYIRGPEDVSSSGRLFLNLIFFILYKKKHNDNIFWLSNTESNNTTNTMYTFFINQKQNIKQDIKGNIKNKNNPHAASLLFSTLFSNLN